MGIFGAARSELRVQGMEGSGSVYVITWLHLSGHTWLHLNGHSVLTCTNAHSVRCNVRMWTSRSGHVAGNSGRTQPCVQCTHGTNAALRSIDAIQCRTTTLHAWPALRLVGATRNVARSHRNLRQPDRRCCRRRRRVLRRDEHRGG